MKSLYSNTPTTAFHFGRGSAVETPILLAAEQILVQSAPQNPKNEQNTIIRLAASIRKYGILEPILVKLSTQKDGYPVYELIDGERRFRAAALAGVDKLPCLVLPPSDPKCLQMAAILQLRSENLHFFALSEAFLRLIEEYHMTQDEIARRMGLSQSAIANKLRLLKLTPEERRIIVAGGLSERHARAFLRISDPVMRLEVITKAQKESHNVASTEALVNQYLGGNAAAKANAEGDSFPQKSAIVEEKQAFFAPIQAKSATNEAFEDKQLPHDSDPASIASQAHTGQMQAQRNEPLLPKKPIRSTQGSGVTPRKFALRDLKPLYNSIERTLGIFEKTGVSAEYHKEEDEDFANILIRIPKKG